MSRIYPCVYCTEDGYCKKYSDEEVTSWCVQSPCKDEKPSHADRIRAMTDEELAEWFSIYCCRNKTYDAHCETFGSCEACWLDWLREDAKE